MNQDHIRSPLNELLGTPANVRLLRLLAEETSTPVSAPDAARQTGLTEAGARRALDRLVKTGFVERLGGGRSRQFRLRHSDPLLGQLAALFRAERDRFQGILSELRAIFRELPEVRVSWIDETPAESGQPLHIGILADPDALTYLEQEVRRRILDIERRIDLTIEVHPFSRADVPEVRWDSATLLAGHVPDSEHRAGPVTTHEERTDRAAKMSTVIGDMLVRDPSLLRRAERHLDYMLEEDQGASGHDLREWRDILSFYSRERLKDFLLSDTSRAQRLRQSSPFFAVLTPEEREELFDAAQEEDA